MTGGRPIGSLAGGRRAKALVRFEELEFSTMTHEDDTVWDLVKASKNLSDTDLSSLQTHFAALEEQP